MILAITLLTITAYRKISNNIWFWGFVREPDKNLKLLQP